ncbi:hypothetical protein ACIPSE_44910 [Streptomyces sp. NPDC090106]|uniref:hypothetical protein n=1 Tax=Streptomyces sp. NPDC090106 TaxID=3365946 RepID=UPI0037FF3974
MSRTAGHPARTASRPQQPPAVRLSATVMAHPRRAASAGRLARLLGGDAEVVYDPLPDGPSNAMRTAVEAWSRCPAGSTHHMVLQDDVVPTADFTALAVAAAARHPDAAIALYANSNSWNGVTARTALLAGYRWVPTVPYDYFPTQVALMPCAMAHEFVAYARPIVPFDGADDEALTRFLDERGHPSALRVPNLVQHDDQPSLTGLDHQGIRRSVVFMEAAGSSPGTDDACFHLLPALPFFRQRRARLRVLLSGRGRTQGYWTVGRGAQLDLLGMDRRRIAAVADSVVARMGESGGLPQRRAVTAAFVAEVYLGALGLGWAAARLARDHGRHMAVLPSPVHDRVLDSYVESGLGFDADLTVWRPHLGLLRELALRGVNESTGEGG